MNDDHVTIMISGNDVD